MIENNDLKRLYTSSEINVNVLKEILTENKISSLIKNDLKTGLNAGFGGGYMEAEASLYVTEENFEQANVILKEFLKSIDSN